MRVKLMILDIKNLSVEPAILFDVQNVECSFKILPFHN